MRSYRRRLPHLRAEGSTYFLTWRLSPNQHDLTDEERSVVASNLHYFDNQRYLLTAFVVMNDHVHVLVQPYPGHELEALIQGWKSYTTGQLQKQTARLSTLWQDEYFDRIIRDASDLADKIAYIENNPAKRWPGIKTYEWLYIGASARRA